MGPVRLSQEGLAHCLKEVNNVGFRQLGQAAKLVAAAAKAHCRFSQPGQPIKLFAAAAVAKVKSAQPASQELRTRNAP
jgi:hypothetical protein